ncbi:MAG: endonuclease/exonuclease/phosphatase family protein [Puniceicoccales bacterium]|jgi:endonuclease/exonuclease/phosphatase family metal-dependent hydrolase|nr:endonuclease/exonuclease/phosphatase family protein [Puniceicoccales bacterium]
MLRRFTAYFFGPFLLLALTAAALEGDRLRVATWNVQNYNLEFRRIEGRNEPAYPKPEKEKTALRLMLHAANADVVALQETGGEAFVEELRRDLAREGLSYPHTAVLTGPDPKRRLAMLSKVPFKKIIPRNELPIRHQGKEDNVARGLLGVTFDTAAGEFTFYTLHLRSRLTRDSSDPRADAQRLAEATAICDILRDAHGGAPGSLVLAGGDFNDAPTSTPLRRFAAARQKIPLSPVPASDSRGETWTYRNLRDDYYSRSDYFLCSPALAAHTSGRARIADLPAGDRASDHRLLFLDLEFAPETPRKD